MKQLLWWSMFRALVMLACLIAIPLAALFGSSLPAVAKAIRQGRLPTIAELRGNAESQPGNLADAPRFIPAACLPTLSLRFRRRRAKSPE